jgi:hypothetical protein
MYRIIAMLLVMLAVSRAAVPALADTAGSGQTLEQALRSGAEAGGALYAGDCAKTRSPHDIGKTCTKLFEERGPMRAYLVGQTFSEFRRWLFLEDGQNVWVVIASAPMDTRANPIIPPWPNMGAQPN